MNKKINIILAALLAVAGVFSMTSCDDDEPNVAKAVLCNVFSLDYTVDGSSQEVKVVSDAQWHVEAPEWITVEPSTGSGTTFVTISAPKNFRDGAPDNPRKGEVIFKGNTKASEAVVVVRQDGDPYRDVSPISAADFYAKANEDVVIINNMTVVSVYPTGFVATDGKTNVNAVYADNATDKPAVGETVTINGSRDTDKYGMAYVLFEKAEKGGTVATAPAAVEIDVDDFSCSTVTAVKFTGLYNASAGTVTVSDKTNMGLVVSIAEGLDLASMSGHNITLTGYCLGVVAPAVNVIATSFVDNGVQEVIFFQEDFEWLEPWSSQAPAGQTVETNNPDAKAQQLGTNKVDDVSTYDALLEKGYKFPICCAEGKSPREPQGQTYLQRNYIKFGLTGYYSGITLPAITDLPDGVKTVICFDWCSQRQGSGIWDPTELVVVVKNGENEEQFLVPTHAYVENEVYSWISVRVDLGASVTKKSEITIRNIDSQWPGGGSALRWFIDNIKVIEK